MVKSAERLAEMLAEFREAEPPAGIAVIVGDEQAVKVLASWSLYTPPAWRTPRGRAPDRASERWEWIWAPVWSRLDMADFAAACGLTAPVAEAKLRVCVHARMIYPDGSIGVAARGLLQAYVQAKLPAQKRKRK